MSLKILVGLVIVFICSAIANAQAKDGEVSTPFFGNEVCPVSGDKADPKLSVEHGKERIFVCCKSCIKKVKADPKAFHAKAYPENAVQDLKNAKCPVMGGKAKKEVSIVFQGRRVHFCCPGCDKPFMKEPNKHLARLTAKTELSDLGNLHCPVMIKNDVEPDSFVIYKGQIINICCAGCAEKFARSPEKYLAAMKAKEKEDTGASKWTCPMHKDVVADEPGKCPKCGMNLVEVKAKKGEIKE